MKKITFILLAVSALLCGCTKSASEIASPDASKVAPLSYDTASLFYSNTGNRATVYKINGQYVKVTVGAIRDEETYKADYFITAMALSNFSSKATADDSDLKSGRFIECKIFKLEDEDYTAVKQVCIDSVPPMIVFADSVKAVEGGAYYVCAFDEEEKAELSFAIVLPSFKITPYKADVTYDPETPYGGPIIVEEDFETAEIKLFYRQFANGKWI